MQKVAKNNQLTFQSHVNLVTNDTFGVKSHNVLTCDQRMSFRRLVAQLTSPFIHHPQQPTTMTSGSSLSKDDRNGCRSHPREPHQNPSSLPDVPDLSLARLVTHGVQFTRGAADASDQVPEFSVRISRQQLLSIIDEALLVASTEGNDDDRTVASSPNQRQSPSRNQRCSRRSSSTSMQERLQ
jgi:hypothetical protein